jgi:hypothetical protein
MALPTHVTLTNEAATVFIVEIAMGSQFRGKSWDIDEFNRQTQYKHGKKIRNEIGALRQQVNTVVSGTCMKFHRKIKFTNAAGKEALIAACIDADRKMKLIDPSLHVTPIFFEQTMTQLNTGNMFELMKQQLNEQINQRILDRIESTIKASQREDGSYKSMSSKTRQALIKMVEGVKAINILNDPTVNARIEAVKAQMMTANLIPMRDELLSYIEDIQGADSLEITPDEITGDEAAVVMAPDAEKDEDEFKARPMTAADEIHVEDLI